ncbi:hypothetical protein BDR07DRAFT_1372167 [Suillus spraguei]|nr:hypothetical protein BDR07DRAFT_1372167 [Suillus spraguei]
MFDPRGLQIEAIPSKILISEISGGSVKGCNGKFSNSGSEVTTHQWILDGIGQDMRASARGSDINKTLAKNGVLTVHMDMGLLRTCKQGHSVESIHDAMLELHEMYPEAGMREIISLLHHEEGMSVSRSVVKSYFAIYEANLICQQKARHLQRRCFWAAGVNDIVAVDQHNKWLWFSLALHTRIKPFSGHIMWMRVWHSNRNLQLILSYYLDTIENLGHMPLVTQSDPRTKNFGIANGHTMLRQWYNSSLQGTLQHRWMRTKKNVMPEIAWSQLRHRFTLGFESLLDHRVEQDWYDSDNTLQVYLIQVSICHTD